MKLKAKHRYCISLYLFTNEFRKIRDLGKVLSLTKKIGNYFCQKVNS